MASGNVPVSQRGPYSFSSSSIPQQQANIVSSDYHLISRTAQQYMPQILCTDPNCPCSFPAFDSAPPSSILLPITLQINLGIVANPTHRMLPNNSLSLLDTAAIPPSRGSHPLPSQPFPLATAYPPAAPQVDYALPPPPRLHLPSGPTPNADASPYDFAYPTPPRPSRISLPLPSEPFSTAASYYPIAPQQTYASLPPPSEPFPTAASYYPTAPQQTYALPPRPPLSSGSAARTSPDDGFIYVFPPHRSGAPLPNFSSPASTHFTCAPDSKESTTYLPVSSSSSSSHVSSIDLPQRQAIPSSSSSSSSSSSAASHSTNSSYGKAPKRKKKRDGMELTLISGTLTSTEHRVATFYRNHFKTFYVEQSGVQVRFQDTPPGKVTNFCVNTHVVDLETSVGNRVETLKYFIAILSPHLSEGDQVLLFYPELKHHILVKFHKSHYGSYSFKSLNKKNALIRAHFSDDHLFHIIPCPNEEVLQKFPTKIIKTKNYGQLRGYDLSVQ